MRRARKRCRIRWFRAIEAEFMGRYIDDILQPGEKVLYSTNAHWIFYWPAIAAWIVAAVFLILAHGTLTEGLVPVWLSLAAIAALAGLYWIFTAWFHR